MGRHSGGPQAGAGLPDFPDDPATAPTGRGHLTPGDPLGSGTGESREFLGSGWRDEPEPPRSSRRPVLLAAASVVVAVGLVAGGVRLMSGHRTGDVVLEPLGATCAPTCLGTRHDAPVSIDGFLATDEPADPTASAGATPSASASAKATPGRTPSPGATPAPPGGSTTGGATAGPTTTPNSPASGGVAVPPSGGGSSAHASAPPSSPATQPAATKQVSVNVRLASQGGGGYTVQLDIRNEAADLPSWTVALPVSGDVAAVGARYWTQAPDGTLSIRSTQPLARGRQTTVVFYAEGSYRAPGGCTLSGGACTVRSGGHR
jgi:hypothetical protein